MAEPLVFNPIDPGVRRDPYAIYERGRKEFPALVHEGLPMPIVSIFRYADVKNLLGDAELFSNDFAESRDVAPEIAALGDLGPPSMIGLDPPDHTRLRSLVNKAFTPRMVRQFEPRMREIAHRLMDEALEKQEVDLIQALTYPLPVIAIAEIIGVPAEDSEQFKVWSDALVANLGADFFQDPTVEEVREEMALQGEMDRYFIPLAEKRRVEPQDDLLTGLVQAEHEGSKLNRGEMLSMLVLLLVAGNETTTTLIGNIALELFDHPDAMASLRADPALMPRAVDEVLRFSSPVQFDPRRATRATEIAGVAINENDLVLGWLGSANRDEAVFENAATFDITREKNPHLAFGYGTHHCLGHNLSRLEAGIATEVLLERTAKIERTDHDELPLHPSPVFKAVSKLPVRLTPA